MADLAVIFAGGGTGGHLYPALAIVQALEQRLPSPPNSLFICSNRPLDAEILAREGVEFLSVPAAPFSTKPLGILRLMRSWAPSVRAARSAIRAFRTEGCGVCVVAMGGFVAPPIVQAARVEKVPRLLINLDAVPGRANRWIAKRADRVLSVNGAGGHESIPPIVRPSALYSGTPEQARIALGLQPDLPTLLITGGSQGAQSLDSLMLVLGSQPNSLPSLAGWQILHQARPKGLDNACGVYEKHSIPAVVTTFIENMGAAWAAADIAIARAGAGAVAEVWANRTPTIFLPYPGHTDDHQRRNARPLVDAGAAIIVRDEQGPMQNAFAVAEHLSPLLIDPTARDRMRTALAALGPADGADHAAQAIIQLSA